MLASLLPTQGFATTPTYVNHNTGWGTKESKKFYSHDQGSKLIDYSWLKALKDPSGKPFLRDSLTRYGFIPNELDHKNILPIGFSHTGNDVGITCAACHTRQININGTAYRIDGGPALIDFQSFLSDLDISVGNLISDTTKFEDFAIAVLGKKNSKSLKTKLKTQLTKWYEPSHVLMSRALPINPWGVGRLDAVSMIFNRLTGLDIGEPQNGYMIPENIMPADAPVRYPFIWNAPFQNKTQWLGFASNGNNLAAMLRNQGEVFGVFGKFHPVFINGKIDYKKNNSTNYAGLKQLENLVTKIPPPKWTSVSDLPSLNPNLVANGKKIFEANCYSGCHEKKIDYQDLASYIINVATFQPFRNTWVTPVKDVLTDTRQWSLPVRQVKTGVLQGETIPFLNIKLKETANSLDVLEVASYGAVIKDSVTLGWLHLVGEYFQQFFPVPTFPTTFPYESRVLEGVWAAAPYLHNGSVPNLRELLKPASQRVASFDIGADYDLQDVGIAIQQTLPYSTLNTTITSDCNTVRDDSGDSRCGHEFGTNLSDIDKDALLEYLKSL